MKLEHARLIGEKLRSARQQRKISLRELAKKAEISASMLSQIETGKAYPSVRSIYDIAAALDLPVDYFFPDKVVDRLVAPDEDAFTEDMLSASEMRDALVNRGSNSGSPFPGSAVAQVVHASDRPTIQLKGGVTWMRLTAAAEPHAEFLEINYAEGASSGDNLSHHGGREFGLVLEGELFIQLGFQEFVLGPGDSIVFDSDTSSHGKSGFSTGACLVGGVEPGLGIRLTPATSCTNLYKDDSQTIVKI